MNNIPTATAIPFIYNENLNLTSENQTKFINENLDFVIDTTKITRKIANILLNQEEYKIVLFFKNGGLLNQLTFNQLKLLNKFYRLTEKDILELKDNPEFIEYLVKEKIISFSSLPETIKKNPIIALKLFAIGNYELIKYIPKELQTQEICDKAFKKTRNNFVFFNDKFKTINMCSQYLINLYDINFTLIPERFRTDLQEIFIDKIRNSSAIKVTGIELIPINMLKDNLDVVEKSCLYNCNTLMKLDSSFVTKELLIKLAKQSIMHVPEKYLDKELVILAIQHSEFYSEYNSSREDKLKILDKYLLLHKEHEKEIQKAISQRRNNKNQQNYLLKYIKDSLLEDECIILLKKDIDNYEYFPDKFKSNIFIIKYLLKDWIKEYGRFSYYSKDIFLQYKNLPEIFKKILPSDFFTQESHLENKHLLYKKTTFLTNIPNECRTLDMWLFLCVNVDREYIKQIPESIVSNELLMQLVDEYVQDDSRFDLNFTEFLFSHKLFNSNTQEKIFTHTLKCSARCSRAFIKILKSSNIPQEFKDEIFNKIMQGNIGYLPPNKTELYAKTNPLQKQVPANFATELLSSLYKFNGFNNLISTELINELKNYMAERQIKALPLDTTENTFTNAKVMGGRTIQVDINANTAIFYKFRKPNENLLDFVKEGYFLEFLAENKVGQQLKQQLTSDIPLLKKMVSMPLSKLPDCVQKCEDGLDESDTKCVDVLIFSGSRDYLQYAHKPDMTNPTNPFMKPETGLLTASHDLGVFMSKGIYHTTTLPFYHEAKYSRRWSILNMILRGLPFTSIRDGANGYFYLNQHKFSMTGKLEYWDSKATERPDYGYSGLRDLADYEFYGEIVSISNREDSEAVLFESIKQKIYAANSICECLMAIIFLYARLHKFADNYHYTNDNCHKNTATFIENMFTSFLTGILQDETINLQKFMQLTDEDYQQWLDRSTTELLYWTAQQPEIKDITSNKTEKNDDPKTQEYFAVHVNRKQLPTNLFDDTTVPANIKYPESFTIQEAEKTHNSLGMYNGTFPLLALTNFMILLNTKLNEYKA